MEKWSFNDLLFSRLSDVLDISGTEIARRCGITQQVFSRYTTNEVVVSVQVLIKICNALRMPCYYFVSEDNNHVLPDRESATIVAAKWIPISWDSQAVEHTFGDGEGRIYWKDVAEAMGVSLQKPHDRFLLITRFPVNDFLTTCSHLNISPFRFLIDQNRDNGKQRNKRRVIPTPGLSVDITLLRQQIAELSKTTADLTDRYRALLDRQSRLERKVNEFLKDNETFLAAEPGPESVP